MKNGRAMKGHRRVATPVGISLGRNQGFSGGWDVSCICGWQGGNFPNRTLSLASYRKHIDYQIDQCLIRCKRCGEEKPLSQMRRDYRYICLKCDMKRSHEWQDGHPHETARSKRNHHLLKKFGISLVESEKILNNQGGVCAICHQLISDARGYSPHVDHDHISGMVRGILCFSCNVGLGVFKDDPKLLLSAIRYLNSVKRGKHYEMPFGNPTLGDPDFNFSQKN